MNLKDKKIGVWGFGVVGKSTVNYLLSQGIRSISLMEKSAITPEDSKFLAEHGIALYPETEITQFLASHELIIPSPGIDIRPYNRSYKHKWLSELDLFAQQWQKPLIAITGTIGKTSVTHILSYILEQLNVQIATGGNIGIGMLDLLQNQETADYGLLEVSSFQLEHSLLFAPDLAVITNIYPNHLDRHGTFQEYSEIKKKLFKYQRATQKALLPISLHTVAEQYPERSWCFFTIEKDHPQMRSQDTLYYSTPEGHFVKKYNQQEQLLLENSAIPSISFTENWLIITAVLDILGYTTTNLLELTQGLTLPEHRVDKIATVRDIDFYDDSKSTIIESTIAATKQLEQYKKNIHILIGGISKGVNRAELFKKLTRKVTSVRCFGAESETLKNMALQNNFIATAHNTLEEAFEAAVNNAQAGELILLSPAGASYDLFANYKERGKAFRLLVEQLKKIPHSAQDNHDE